MLLIEIAFALTILISFSTNTILTVFVLARSQISIVLLVFSSFLLTFATIVARLGLESSGDIRISLLSFAGLLVGLSMLVLAFNFPEKTRSQRFWQRAAGISASFTISFEISGTFFPSIFYFVADDTGLSISFILLVIPAVVSFFAGLSVLESLYRLNLHAKEVWGLPQLDGFLVTGIVAITSILLVALYPFLTLDERTYLSILLGVVIENLFYIFLVAYFVQRFPPIPMYRDFMEKGIVGWFLFRMADEGPEAMKISEAFVETQELSPDLVDHLAATVLSIVGLGQEEVDQSTLHPSVFSVHFHSTFVGLAIPMKMTGQFRDSRFKGSTLAVLTLLIPGKIMHSVNLKAVKGMDIDPDLMGESNYYIIDVCMDVLKRIFD